MTDDWRDDPAFRQLRDDEVPSPAYVRNTRTLLDDGRLSFAVAYAARGKLNNARLGGRLSKKLMWGVRKELKADIDEHERLRTEGRL